MSIPTNRDVWELKKQSARSLLEKRQTVRQRILTLVKQAGLREEELYRQWLDMKDRDVADQKTDRDQRRSEE